MTSSMDFLLTLEPEHRYRVQPKDWEPFNKLLFLGLGEDISSQYSGAQRGFRMNTAGALVYATLMRNHRYQQAIQITVEELEALPQPFRFSQDKGVFDLGQILQRLKDVLVTK